MSDPNLNKEFKKKKYIADLLCKISNIRGELEARRPCVVIQNEEKEIVFKPVFGNGLAKEYLLPFCDLTLSMSATVLSKEQYCREMGFNNEETMFIRLPSVFPIENHPIKPLSIGSMSFKNKANSKPLILKKVVELLEKHKNERGIIHTVNYELAIYLVENIRTNRFVMPKGKTRDKEIQRFLKSRRKDLVLISPSLQEGIDLKDDLSRFTIILKVPYANLTDPWVKKRMDLCKSWYSEAAVMNIVQMTGRSIRSKDDFAVTYILDSDFTWFFKQNKNKFPKFWQESVVQ